MKISLRFSHHTSSASTFLSLFPKFPINLICLSSVSNSNPRIMQLTNTLFGLVAAATVVYAQVGAPIRVTVGADGVLQYNPNNIVAEVGTEVEFDFFPKNHTVTQSSFANPCHPLANGFFSGFIPTTDSPSGTTFTIKVNDTKPIWFYCGQTIGNHCQAGTFILSIHIETVAHVPQVWSVQSMLQRQETHSLLLLLLRRTLRHPRLLLEELSAVSCKLARTRIRPLRRPLYRAQHTQLSHILRLIPATAMYILSQLRRRSSPLRQLRRPLQVVAAGVPRLPRAPELLSRVLHLV